jgi:hypothetical protein
LNGTACPSRLPRSRRSSAAAAALPARTPSTGPGGAAAAMSAERAAYKALVEAARVTFWTPRGSRTNEMQVSSETATLADSPHLKPDGTAPVALRFGLSTHSSFACAASRRQASNPCSWTSHGPRSAFPWCARSRRPAALLGPARAGPALHRPAPDGLARQVPGRASAESYALHAVTPRVFLSPAAGILRFTDRESKFNHTRAPFSGAQKKQLLCRLQKRLDPHVPRRASAAAPRPPL